MLERTWHTLFCQPCKCVVSSSPSLFLFVFLSSAWGRSYAQSYLGIVLGLFTFPCPLLAFLLFLQGRLPPRESDARLPPSLRIPAKDVFGKGEDIGPSRDPGL
jgi:hypothetical protein